MARSYRQSKRIHVYISEKLNELIQDHLIDGESRTAFIQKCVTAYIEQHNPYSPVSKLDHEHVIKYYFQRYFGNPPKQP